MPGAVLTGCSNEFNMDATVLYNDGVFSIFNNNDLDWYHVAFYLNYEDDDVTTGYEYKTTAENGEIPVFQNGRFIEANLFHDAEGNEYDPEAEPPIILMIKGQNYDGKTGTYVKKW